MEKNIKIVTLTSMFIVEKRGETYARQILP